MESKVFYQRTRVGDDTVSAQDIVTSSRWRSTGMETENPLENVSTFSNMNTKTYGLQSEITKDYGAQALNYGVNFSITDFPGRLNKSARTIPPCSHRATTEPMTRMCG